MNNKRISTEVIEDVLRKVNIVDVVSNYIELIKKGNSYKGLCPFHADSNPSLSVSEDKQIFKCFSCQASGNAIKFVQDYEKISFLEAVKNLADYANIKIDASFINSKNNFTDFYEITKMTRDYYKFYLTGTVDGKNALNYLHERGITIATINKFGIGLSPNKYNHLFKTLTSKGIDELKIEKLGLVTKKDKYFDFFRNRIIFPINDHLNNVVGFSGRILENDSNSPKYVNSAESIIFKKSNILYNLNNAVNEIKKNDRIIIMEGFSDVIAADNAGLKEVVATMGTALTKNHLSLIKKYTDNILICFDGDDAGLAASYNSLDTVKQFNVSIVVIPESLDPDEYIKKYSKENFIELVNNKNVSILDFMYYYKLKDVDPRKINEAENFKRTIFKMLKGLPNTVKEIYLKKLSKTLNVEYTNLIEDFNFKVPSRIVTKSKNSNRYIKAECALLYQMSKSKEQFLKTANFFESKLNKIEHDNIYRVFIKYYEETNCFNRENFLNLLGNVLSDYYLKYCLKQVDYQNSDYIEDCKKILRKQNPIEKRRFLVSKVEKLDKNNADNKFEKRELTMEIEKLDKIIHDIK